VRSSGSRSGKAGGGRREEEEEDDEEGQCADDGVERGARRESA